MICDFGTSKFMESVNCNYVCTRFYRAPEQILDCGYTFSADMWSFGCIVAEVSLGTPLFQGRDNVSQLVEIIRKLGTLSDEQGSRIPGLEYDCVRRIANVKPTPWASVLTVRTSRGCVNVSYGRSFEDLLDKTLLWVPCERLTPKGCTLHRFLCDP